MRTKVFLGLFWLLGLCGSLNAQEITGFWKSIDDKTGKMDCVLAVYEYENKYYGRIITTCNDNGVIEDSIYAPKKRAPGVKGNPFYCGMDIIWNLCPQSSWYVGKIIDPKKGNVYSAQLFLKEGALAVRGKLLIFSRTELWPAAQDSDFPAGFKKPDCSKFVPVIPQKL